MPAPDRAVDAAHEPARRSASSPTTPPAAPTRSQSHLTDLGIQATPDEVSTSAQAAATVARRTSSTPARRCWSSARDALVDEVELAGPEDRAHGTATRSRPSSRGFRRTPAGGTSPRRASRSGPARCGSRATPTPPCRPSAGRCPVNGSLVAALRTATAPSRSSPASRRRRCWTRPPVRRRPSSRWSSATGWTPTSPARSPPGWTRCSSCPASPPRRTSSTRRRGHATHLRGRDVAAVTQDAGTARRPGEGLAGRGAAPR